MESHTDKYGKPMPTPNCDCQFLRHTPQKVAQPFPTHLSGRLLKVHFGVPEATERGRLKSCQNAPLDCLSLAAAAAAAHDGTLLFLGPKSVKADCKNLQQLHTLPLLHHTHTQAVGVKGIKRKSQRVGRGK